MFIKTTYLLVMSVMLLACVQAAPGLTHDSAPQMGTQFVARYCSSFFHTDMPAFLGLTGV
jgi:hypothetical protein